MEDLQVPLMIHPQDITEVAFLRRAFKVSCTLEEMKHKIIRPSRSDTADPSSYKDGQMPRHFSLQ